jgi:hypothetical protein
VCLVGGFCHCSPNGGVLSLASSLTALYLVPSESRARFASALVNVLKEYTDSESRVPHLLKALDMILSQGSVRCGMERA